MGLLLLLLRNARLLWHTRTVLNTSTNRPIPRAINLQDLSADATMVEPPSDRPEKIFPDANSRMTLNCWAYDRGERADSRRTKKAGILFPGIRRPAMLAPAKKRST